MLAGDTQTLLCLKQNCYCYFILTALIYNEPSIHEYYISLDMRLVNGTSPGQGRVEVYHAGEWGTVCDDQWSLENINVVCQALGYPVASEVNLPLQTSFGHGMGNIILDDVTCLGNETDLFECQHERYFETNCGHSEDISVTCLPGKIMFFV